MRASVSVGPPAGNGTMIVIGRDGKSCAAASAMYAETANAAASESLVIAPRAMCLPHLSPSNVAGAMLAAFRQACHCDVNALAGTVAATHACFT